MARKKWLWWGLWAALSMAGATVLAMQLFTVDQKSYFLPGKTTHGHHQIELQCPVCHGDGFDSAETLQKSCINCHGDELHAAQDSHPRSKFTNPRNANLLAHLDARECVACHVEHRPELISHMGVSQPIDVCAHCHQDIARDRPSHKGMGFDTCQNAGCHNFHDNLALYEDFLLEHADEPADLPRARVPTRNFASRYLSNHDITALLTVDQVEQQSVMPAGQTMPDDWAHSSHAAASVQCSDCHGKGDSWRAKPDHQACAGCHRQEVDTFLRGMHGMRLAQDLSPMTPAQSDLPFHSDKAHQSLTCNTCHDAHTFNTVAAAVEKCMGCHDDDHTNAYKQSPHYLLWQREQRGDLPAGSGVSCATCHMPRVEVGSGANRKVFVNHNQNDNLRPNEKMLRSVCMNCHGLGFSLDALADPGLIDNNFSGPPAEHVRSIDMAVERDKEKASRHDNGLY